MYNPYSVILVSQKHYPEANFKDALRFVTWLTNEGLVLIEKFQVQGQQVFFAKER